jgi:hypothetical protein
MKDPKVKLNYKLIAYWNSHARTDRIASPDTRPPISDGVSSLRPQTRPRSWLREAPKAANAL